MNFNSLSAMQKAEIITATSPPQRGETLEALIGEGLAEVKQLMSTPQRAWTKAREAARFEICAMAFNISDFESEIDGICGVSIHKFVERRILSWSVVEGELFLTAQGRRAVAHLRQTLGAPGCRRHWRVESLRVSSGGGQANARLSRVESVTSGVTEIVNLTPHEINITDGPTIPPSGNLARREEKRVGSPPIEGIKVEVATYGDIIGLPEPRPGTIFIVSGQVLAQVPGRADVFAPGKAVRDKDGKIVGCQGLSGTPAYLVNGKE